jgi:chitinase
LTNKITLDNDQYNAHAGLLNRSLMSTQQLQQVDKALSNPQAVVQDIAGSNGQNCFVYTGSCVNLNDNNAIAQACGSGFTAVGWDDDGCGKKNCVSASLQPGLIQWPLTNANIALRKTRLLSNQ